jgi:hypothetical protein
MTHIRAIYLNLSFYQAIISFLLLVAYVKDGGGVLSLGSPHLDGGRRCQCSRRLQYDVQWRQWEQQQQQRELFIVGRRPRFASRCSHTAWRCHAGDGGTTKPEVRLAPADWTPSTTTDIIRRRLRLIHSNVLVQFGCMDARGEFVAISSMDWDRVTSKSVTLSHW